LLEKLGGLLADLHRPGEEALVTRARHREGLRNCAELLMRAAVAGDAGPEVRAELLRQAGDWIGRISGRIDVEDVLGAIFAEFCIGK
jgi:tRNA modification GTPase